MAERRKRTRCDSSEHNSEDEIRKLNREIRDQDHLISNLQDDINKLEDQVERGKKNHQCFKRR